MTTDAEIKMKGFQALLDSLGALEAERFIALLLREPFDYTQWQRSLWMDKSVQEISAAASKFRGDQTSCDKKKQ
jgi:hypothetical protein